MEWRFILKALPFCALECFCSAIAIIDLAMIPTEAEFIAIAMQMLRTDMMERAHHATLEKRKISFCRIDVDIAASILGFAVVNSLMTTIELRTDAAI